MKHKEIFKKKKSIEVISHNKSKHNFSYHQPKPILSAKKQQITSTNIKYSSQWGRCKSSLSNKNKKQICLNECLSERYSDQQQKLMRQNSKHRRFSSHIDEAHLSGMNLEPKKCPVLQTNSSDSMSFTKMQYLLVIRNLFVEQFLKFGTDKAKYSTIQNQLSKITHETTKILSLQLQQLPYEEKIELHQLITCLDKHVKAQVIKITNKLSISIQKVDPTSFFQKSKCHQKQIPNYKITFQEICEIIFANNGLLQATNQKKSQKQMIPKQNQMKEKSKAIDNIGEEPQQTVETARFQQNNQHLLQNQMKKKKNLEKQKSIKQHLQIESQIEEEASSFKDSSEGKSKQQLKNALHLTNSNSYEPLKENKSHRKQSIPPSLNPFNIFQKSKTQQDQFEDDLETHGLFGKSEEIFNKVPTSLRESSKVDDRTYTSVYRKQPSSLLESAILNSLNKFNISSQIQQNSNISFSMDQMAAQNEKTHQISFQQTIISLEEVLKNLQQFKKSIDHRKSVMDAHSPPTQKTSAQQVSSSEEINSFIRQLIDYNLSKKKSTTFLSNKQSSYFYTVKIEDLQNLSSGSQKLIIKILQNSSMKEYFSVMEGVKVSECERIFEYICPLFSSKLRMLNISNNNIVNLSNLNNTLDEANNCLEFLNINNNKIKNISWILLKFSALRELHCKKNQIDHVSGQNIIEGQINLIDLSYNLIAKEEYLSGLRFLKKLTIINLLGNPLLENKLLFAKIFDKSQIYEYPDIYMLSEYAQYKQITFAQRPLQERKPSSKQITNNMKETKQQKPNVSQSNNLIKPQQIIQRNKAEGVSKGTNKCISQGERQSTKQKISKIKTFYEGKVL